MVTTYTSWKSRYGIQHSSYLLLYLDPFLSSFSNGTLGPHLDHVLDPKRPISSHTYFLEGGTPPKLGGDHLMVIHTYQPIPTDIPTDIHHPPLRSWPQHKRRWWWIDALQSALNASGEWQHLHQWPPGDRAVDGGICGYPVVWKVWNPLKPSSWWVLPRTP